MSSSLFGSFRLEQELAREATHTTYLASHRVLPRTAIVKVMDEVPDAASQFVAVRLLREACLMAALQHAGVPAVYESGLLADRRPWFAVEYVAGPTLATLLEKGSIDRHQAIIVLRDLAEVLAHAHQNGVVHGGLRPDQVVLANRPHGFALCVTDWSSARTHDATPMPYTPTIDSYHFTAPEVQNAHPADHRADSYSLGVITHQLMSGLPYARGKQIATAAIPQDIIGLVEGMLAESPNDRPSCRDVHREAMNLVDALSQQMTLPSHFRIRKPKWTPDVLYRKLGDTPSSRDAFDADDDVE